MGSPVRRVAAEHNSSIGNLALLLSLSLVRRARHCYLPRSLASSHANGFRKRAPINNLPPPPTEQTTDPKTHESINPFFRLAWPPACEAILLSLSRLSLGSSDPNMKISRIRIEGSYSLFEKVQSEDVRCSILLLSFSAGRRRWSKRRTARSQSRRHKWLNFAITILSRSEWNKEERKEMNDQAPREGGREGGKRQTPTDNLQRLIY